jgi:protein-S-isoprenylcysteine O-methyltransferase Ste14/Flp pilus assembly pilin Flp
MGRRALTATFVVLATATTVEAARSYADAISSPASRAWLDAVYMTFKVGVVVLFAVSVARRSEARRRVRRVSAFLACAGAIAAGLVLQRPAPTASAALVVAGESLAVVACCWMVAAAAALGRCFGVLPEARGLVTHGPYHVVRHPLYLGELGVFAGLVVASPTARNLVAALILCVAQGVRMEMEERELSSHFPEYATYADHVPRLVPGLKRAAGRGLPRLAPEDGQTLVEYAAILTIVSIAGVAALTVIGGILNVDFLQIAGAF